MNRRSLLTATGAFLSSQALGPRGLSAASQDSATGHRVAITCPTSTIDEFRRLVDLSVELGVTHVSISDLLKDRWQWVDRNDPYPNWSMQNPSLLKVAVPEALRRWIPADPARRNMETIARRGEILRKHGLKATFSGCEPMWLPDAVYNAHPEWRGPYCEEPTRAKRHYFAPCIDHTEVLAMYRKAAEELCRLAPIESFSFFTNDSGAGLCWHPELYPGANGPEWCKNRSGEQRVRGFMSALQEGARTAGVEADISIAGERLDGRNRTRRPGARAGVFGYYYSSHTYPVIEIPQPFTLAEQLEPLLQKPSANWSFGVPSISVFSSFDLLREFRKNKIVGTVARIQALNTVATHQVGPEAADSLMKAWEQIARAVDVLSPIESGGPVLLLGSVNQRWLVRPLVPFPLALKPEEKDYYRKFQFQARSEEAAANMMDCQGTMLITGRNATWLASNLFDAAIGHLEAASNSARQAAEKARDKQARDEMKALVLRLRALTCVVRNAMLTAKYQVFLDRTKARNTELADQMIGPKGTPEEALRTIEADIENTKELIKLLESSPVPLLAMASTPQEEDVFTFGPDLVTQLRRKIEITNNHLREHQA